MQPEVPEHFKQAAEEVRAHLVTLRGGAPFLSPADTLQLVRWLDDGVAVSQILEALERAADARRRARSRRPLSLVGARRHLGKPMAAASSLVPLAEGSVEAAGLADALAAVEGQGEEAVRRAVAAMRAFLEEAWRSRGDEGREALRTQARHELGDLLHLVDDGVAEALVDETARDFLRQGYPALTVASIREHFR